MSAFWQGRRVFMTGHTGFKGGWLALWLQRLGAQVTGYSLAPPTQPSLFETAQVGRGMTSIIGDILDLPQLQQALAAARPEVVLHLAAQPLVHAGYDDPVETYRTNLMGTVHLLEAVRRTPGVKAVVNVTTDKCYENREWVWGYREADRLGGFDPYSNSKACSELATQSFRSAFFHPDRHGQHGVGVATARAGNVIGGGDWGQDRLVPDILRAIAAGQPVKIRRPDSVRPWQHVLEPLSGYLLLAERLAGDGVRYGGGWNFGPRDEDARPVRWIVEQLARLWGPDARWELDSAAHPHEARFLKLDCGHARDALGWKPRLALGPALEWIVEWHRALAQRADVRALCLAQIERFDKLPAL
jgi:CDP-glucose 4,6-dehydratase